MRVELAVVVMVVAVMLLRIERCSGCIECRQLGRMEGIDRGDVRHHHRGRARGIVMRFSHVNARDRESGWLEGGEKMQTDRSSGAR